MSETSQPVKMTKRKCRWCEREYRAPKGTCPKGCPDCAPTLFDAQGAGRDHTA